MFAKSCLLALLAAAAMASPIHEAQDVTLAMRQSAVTTQQLADFKIYAEYSAASYCNGRNTPGQLIACSGSACNQVSANRPSTVATFSGFVTGIEGFVATDPVRREIILSIRGSSNVRNWITNFQFLSGSCDLVRRCRVHSGFNNAWNEISVAAQNAVRQARSANPSYRVVTTGHSLGGAVATLAAAYLRAGGIPTELYTYGAPRVGNEEFANFVSRQPGGHFRITHGADPVPKVPPFAFGYRHTTPEYWLNGGSSRTIDYGIRDIKVCTGTLSFGCNNGLDIPDAVSHMYYINSMGGCSPGGFDVRVAGEVADLDAVFDRIIEVDREYIKENRMPNNSSMTV